MKFEQFPGSALRTDLAAERHRADLTTPGVDYRESREGSVGLTRLTITSKEGAREIGKPCGTYLTLTFPALFAMNEDEERHGAQVLTRCLAELLPQEDGHPLLVAGLGNRSLTADAVGPLTAERIPATGHLRDSGICVLTPGVMGQSGTEAGTVIRGVVREIGARAVIVIDALCARSPERLACTVQIANTGLTPGSGIRLPRAAVDAAHIGVPVIAVGVPTIVSSAALVYHALERAGAEEIPDAFAELFRDDHLYVCPKSIDEGIENAARLLALGICRLG